MNGRHESGKAMALAVLVLQLGRICRVEAADVGAFDWEMASREKSGIQKTELERVWTDLEARHTAVFLVIRDDSVVFERYAPGQSRTTKHYTASMAKAVVG